VRPSTPAVLRPALTSVTRRTLTSALLRDRSIIFCRFRALLRSPACDAAKIRCRSRRTFSSAWPQSTWSQSGKPSSGPFTGGGADATAPGVPFMVSNLPFGSGVSACFPPQAHQARVSALSGRAAAPVRPVMREPLAEEPVNGPGFPLPFGCRHSLLGPSCARWGVEPSSRPADRQVAPAGPQRGCHVPLGRGATGVGAAWTPGTVVRSRPVVGHRPAPAAFQRRSLFSRLLHSACGSPRNEASSAIHSRSPVRPFPGLCPPGETGALGPLPGLRTPRSPATHARAGTVPANWTGNYVTDMSRPSFCEFHSLQATSCRTQRSW